MSTNEKMLEKIRGLEEVLRKDEGMEEDNDIQG